MSLSEKDKKDKKERGIEDKKDKRNEKVVGVGKGRESTFGAQVKRRDLGCTGNRGKKSKRKIIFKS